MEHISVESQPKCSDNKKLDPADSLQQIDWTEFHQFQHICCKMLMIKIKVYKYVFLVLNEAQNLCSSSPSSTRHAKYVSLRVADGTIPDSYAMWPNC